MDLLLDGLPHTYGDPLLVALARSWGALGRSWGDLGRSWLVLGAILGILGALWGCSGGVLGVFWVVLFIDIGVVESWELGKATESRRKLKKAEGGWGKLGKAYES